MIIKKSYLFPTALALLLLASCSSDEFVGENNPQGSNGSGGAISFSTGASATTRANITEGTAANLLNENFVFYGTKGTTPATVFDNYQANWVTNTANTTVTNTNDWEYVSYKNVPDGVTTNVGVKAFSVLTGSGQANANAIDQTIKYWDYNETQYDFAAYSLGKGTGATPTYATSSKIAASPKSYTLTGSADELKACYISDLVTKYNRDAVSDYGTPVQFKFRSLAAKIRLAFYETIPGYSVKDVKFYTSADATLATNGTESDPTLFASSALLPSGNGTVTVTFPTTGWDNKSNTDYNKAHVTFTKKTDGDVSSTLVLEDLANYAAAEYKEATGSYLGRTSKTATYAGGLVDADGDNTPESGKYYTILPYETGTNLTLRIKYTLVSRDGSGETITVDNATAVIPAELAKWSSNYAYTYIFKIGDMTNGSTGTDGSNNIVYGLTPITLDAVVVDSEDGVQETITTVSTPSITTYAEGKVVTANDEYVAAIPIYIIVNNGTSNETLTDKAKLYTASIEAGAAQSITEETVANAIAKGTYDDGAKTYTVTDANSKKLVVTESNLLSLDEKIAAADSPTGNEITIGTNAVGKFTPAAGTIYVFQYEIEAPVAAVTYNATTAAEYNAALPGAISTGDVAYSFTSYADNSGNTQHGTGKVKQISQDGGSTTVLVTSNTPVNVSADNFVGQQFKVNSTSIDVNTYYELLTIAGASTGIYVKVESSSFDATDVNNYNATLPGAVSAGQTKPALPGKYQYKVIKIKS